MIRLPRTERTRPAAAPVAHALAARLADAWALLGLALITWLAFGRVITELGHHGDSWAYMVKLSTATPFALLENQPGRVALPLAWTIGYLLSSGEAWGYHLLSTLFVLGAAICLYYTLLTLTPGATLFAFTAAALSILWPSDPTRFDAATLGNRQALFFFALGGLLFARAWFSARPRLVIGCAVALTLSLLTYEGQLLIIVALTILALVAGRCAASPRLSLFLGTALPVACWVVVNMLAIVTARGRPLYQTDLLARADPTAIVNQILEGSRVLLVDAWLTPLGLLRAGVVPDGELVVLGTTCVFVWMLVLLPCRSGLPRQRQCVRLLGGAVVTIPLALAIFAVAGIPMSQPDRTQTFSLAAGSVAGCAALVLLLSWFDGSRRRAQATVRMLFVFACLPLVALAFSMTAIYQRNYRQSWQEQRLILGSLFEQAPRIAHGTLVVISGLPDSRIIMVSGYTCEYAVMYLARNPDVEPAFRTQRVGCGLLFNGRDLDAQVHIKPMQATVLDDFSAALPPFQYMYSYSDTIFFRYVEGYGLELLDQIPPELVPPGADVSAYNPRALISPRAAEQATAVS